MTTAPALKRIRNLSRELAADFRTRTAEHDRNRTAPVENMRLLGEAGLTGLLLPEALGGMGLGLEGWLAAAEELGQGCPTTAYGLAAHMQAVGLIFHELGAPDTLQRPLAERIVTEGLLLTTCAPDCDTPELVARPAPGGYRLSGRVPQVPMWESARYALLPARLDAGSTQVSLLVDTRGEGVVAHDHGKTLGLRGAGHRAVTFSGAFVPTEYLLGSMAEPPPAWKLGPATAACLGIGLGILGQTRMVLMARQGASGPDGERRLALMTTELEAARLALWQGARLHREQGSAAAVTRQMLIARYLTLSAVVSSTRSCVVACGARSLLYDLGLEQLIRDAVTAAGQSPDEDQCLHQIAAVELGGLYRSGGAQAREGQQRAAF